MYLLTSKYVLNSHFALACFVGNLLHACTLLDKKCICTSLYNLCHRLHRDDSIGEEYVCPLFHCYLDEAMDSLFHLCFNWTPPHPGPRNTTTARGLTVFWCQAVSSRRRRGFSLLLLINASELALTNLSPLFSACHYLYSNFTDKRKTNIGSGIPLSTCINLDILHFASYFD